jgi:hypothetical protein
MNKRKVDGERLKIIQGMANLVEQDASRIWEILSNAPSVSLDEMTRLKDICMEMEATADILHKATERVRSEIVDTAEYREKGEG